MPFGARFLVNASNLFLALVKLLFVFVVVFVDPLRLISNILCYFPFFCVSFLTGENTKTEGYPMTETTTAGTCTSYPDHIPLALRIYLGG